MTCVPFLIFAFMLFSTLNYSDIELKSKQVHVASIADFSRQNIYIYINKRKWNLTDTEFKKDIRPNLKSFIS